MNNYFLAFITIFSLFLGFSSCGEAVEKSNKKKVENLIEVKNGVYTEYYPGRKAIKMQGSQLKNGDRNGRWFLYAENGVEMSMTEYSNGNKQGFTFVRFPNGAMRYNGEYSNDKQSGLWKFYDEQGKVIQEIDYSKEK